jgi:two-component system, cell cycle response regulator
MSADSDNSATIRPKTLVVDARAVQNARSVGILTVVGGVETGRVFAIPVGESTLGRAAECTFRVDDASVSGVHARVARLGPSHLLTDAGSTNGSFVNDVPVKTSVVLNEGDRIQLGSATFLRYSRVTEEEEQALRKVYDAALRDGLTGVFNRKHLEERLDAEIAYALRHQTELSLVIFDVDHFKRVNDMRGHLAGDLVLKTVAQIIAHGVRAEDVLGRYGGEEFVIVTRGISVTAAFLMAERIRVILERTRIEYGDGALTVTVSAGVASLVCCQGRRDKATFVGLADSRLYKAKEGGRNRVVAAE